MKKQTKCLQPFINSTIEKSYNTNNIDKYTSYNKLKKCDACEKELAIIKYDKNILCKSCAVEEGVLQCIYCGNLILFNNYLYSPYIDYMNENPICYECDEEDLHNESIDFESEEDYE